MKNGLSYFDNGGEVSVTTAKSKTGITPSGPTKLGPEETESILANMQALIDKRTGPMSTFLGGLQEASAWGAGGEQGPSAALTAVRRQRQLEEADTMGMQEKMAAFRAAQAQAKADAERVGKFTAPGGTGVPQLSPEAQARFDLARSPTEKIAIINEDLKARGGERAKAEFNPASMDRKEALIRNPNNGQIELREVNAFEYRDLQAKGLIVPASEMYGAGTGTKPTTAAPAGNILSQIQNSVYQTESSGGKADTSKPGVQGAIGPMQITQDTWNTNVARGVIPKNLDINNPKDNKLAGDKLIEYYYNKFGGDVDKTLAAYHGGEGAINPDGTINTNRKDANGMTIGNYIAKNKAQISVAPAATTTTPGIPDISKIKAERKITETEDIAAATKRGTTSEDERVVFRADTNPETVSNALVSTRRVQDLVKNNPTIAGVLQEPGVGPAIAKVLEKGVGNFGIQDIEEAIYRSLPTTTRQSLGERNELITYLAQIELQAAKLIKGQGQITEGEREILARASSSIKDPAESIYKKAKILEALARKNDEMGKLYRSADKSQTRNFTDFIDKDPTIQKLNAQYRKELTEIVNEKVDFSKSRAAAGGAKKVQHPADIQAIINKGKPQ